MVVENLRQHGAGQVRVWSKFSITDAIHQIAQIDEFNGLIIPCGRRHILEGILPGRHRIVLGLGQRDGQENCRYSDLAAGHGKYISAVRLLCQGKRLSSRVGNGQTGELIAVVRDYGDRYALACGGV